MRAVEAKNSGPQDGDTEERKIQIAAIWKYDDNCVPFSGIKSKFIVGQGYLTMPKSLKNKVSLRIVLVFASIVFSPLFALTILLCEIMRAMSV